MVQLRLVPPPWTQKDWERASSFELVQGRVTVAPIRHPHNDNTWTVGIYAPFVSDRAGPGHRLRACVSKCQTYEDAQRVVGFISYDVELDFIGLNIPPKEQKFWSQVREPWP